MPKPPGKKKPGKTSQIAKRARTIAATRLATAQGAIWANLSKEEKLAWKQRSRKEVNKEDQKKAVRMLAKKQAKQGGSNWKDLTKEQRQSFIKSVKLANHQTE